jgi:hypothetical protein
MTPEHRLPSTARVKQLWDRCLAWEKLALDEDAHTSKERLNQNLAFGPLLLSNPDLETEIDPADPPDVKAEKNEYAAEMYRQLLKFLRTASEDNQKWRVLAMWLKQEQIWEPDAFLPKAIFRRLMKETLSPLGRVASFRPAELLYAQVVEAWVPYFDLLVASYRIARRERLSTAIERLRTHGFDSDAVEAVKNQGRPQPSANEAAYWFVAPRLIVGVDTVRVAHSRIYGRLRRCTPTS